MRQDMENIMSQHRVSPTSHSDLLIVSYWPCRLQEAEMQDMKP